jgi:hypothetical protein
MGASPTVVQSATGKKPRLPIVSSDRYEWVADISLPTLNAPYQLPTNGGIIPSDRFISSMRLEVEYRVTNPASGNPTAVLADAPFSFLENIHVEGYHRIRKAKEPFIDIRGADAREWNLIWYSRVPYVGIVVNGSAASAIVVTASATNDVRFFIEIPFWPEQMSLRQKLGYLLDAPNYDNLQLTLRIGDSFSLFSGQTTNPTFSAFGSATGSPRVRVGFCFAQFGKKYLDAITKGFLPGRVWRYAPQNDLTAGDIVNGATGSRLLNIPRGNRIRQILLKTGTKATTTSAGNNAYSALSDTILSNIKAYRGTNKVTKFFQDYQCAKQDVGFPYSIQPDVGYAYLDWAKRGVLFEHFDATGTVQGPTGDVDCYIAADIAGAAGQGFMAFVEELRGYPVLPLL